MRIVISFLFIFSTFALYGVGPNSFPPPQDSLKNRLQKSKHPTVFQIGERSDAFEDLSLIYDNSLIQAFDNDMDVAYKKWMDMLCAVEAYADKKKFNIKGVKIWVKVFWDNEGEVDHFAYHLKPNSRNISTTALTKFFNDFTRHYTFPVETAKFFSHYGTASFPNYYCK